MYSSRGTPPRGLPPTKPPPAAAAARTCAPVCLRRSPWLLLAVALIALAAVLVSGPGLAHGSSHDRPGKLPISNWDRLLEGLRVHWYAPASDGGSPILRYEVQYKEPDDTAWSDGPRVGITRKATIVGLDSNTEYQARVRAVNANGAGPWSDDAADKRTTRSSNAAADPPDVTVIPRNGALTVSLDPPDFAGSPSPGILHYNVQYTPFDGSPYTYKNWTVNGSADIIGTSVTITGLENGQDHLVRVRAQNGNTDGHWSVDYHGIPTPDTPFLKVEELVTDLEVPWDLAFTPDGTMLFTQRKGVLSARLADGTVRAITADLADVSDIGEGGLMSIVVDPKFSTNRRFYTCQTTSAPPSLEVEVIAWTMDADYTKATRANDPLVGAIPGRNGRHNGCRLRFGPDGYLWITTGDAAGAANPQSLSSLAGKVLRVNASDGSGATGNPFTSSPLIYTYGHRNAQGLALRPDTRQMWVVEHGPTVDDEINLLKAGGNYGWDPVFSGQDPPRTYFEYVPMTDHSKFPGAVAAKWSSGHRTLATSGGIFLEGEHWGNWEGRLAVATLKDRQLQLFAFDADGEFQSRLSVPELDETYGRLRSPVMGPDGALYITTSKSSGDLILKVTAVSPPAAPGEVAVARGDSGELVAEWPAPSDAGSSAITGYQLRYSKDGTTWTDVSGTVTGKRWTVIGGLDDGDEYHLQVRAVNSDGAGGWSPSGRGTPAAPPVIRVETVVTGVSKPWGLAFAPDGTMMFTERGGRLKVRLVDGTVRTVNADFSDIGADWETGLMGMVVDPDFATNRHFYTCQGHQDPRTNTFSVQVIKWSMNTDYTAATRVMDPLVGGVGIRISTQWQHAGCRLRFGPQGHLWIATGDGYDNRINPQSLTNLNGKVLRVHKDTGEGVPGNPFYDRANADTKRIYTYGHRNPQGLARRPGSAQMWSVEHGTDRNDEINLLTAGGNYGYAPLGSTVCGDDRSHDPSVYCIDAPMTDLERFPEAVEARWSSGQPTLATSGGIFVEGQQWDAWEGRLAVATLRTRSLRLFNFTPGGGGLVSEYSLPQLDRQFGRLRTPMMGTDGALYVTTSNNTSGHFQDNDEGIDRILRVYVYDAQADATLTGLSLTGSDGNPVTVSPGFSTGILRYSLEVTDDITSITVNPSKSRSGATVTVNGNDPATAVALDPGPNTISVVVTAQDGATSRTYTIDATQTVTATSPAVSAEISDVTLAQAGASATIALGDHFSDADGDALTYQAASGDSAKVAVSVDNVAGELTVTGAARGRADVTVTATDDDSNSASDTFTVTVKAAPVVAAALADVSGLAAGTSRDVSLSGVFTDADGDALTITTESSNDAVAGASLSLDTLTVAALAEGSATITVTAQDSDGNTVSDAFDVEVVKATAATLSGLTASGTVVRDVLRDGETVTETFTFDLFPNPWFDPATSNYTIRVPSDIQSITFTPTWTETRITAVRLHERTNGDSSVEDAVAGASVTVSGTAATTGANPRFPALQVAASGTDPLVHYFNLDLDSLGFDGATVKDKTFTAGAEISLVDLNEAEIEALRLPKASGGFYRMAYEATGLPAGLHMGHDRIIRGTPTEATTNPVEVTYTATDEIGGSASLTFEVSVVPAVTFDEGELSFFVNDTIEYTIGQAGGVDMVLPEASGGDGALTYSLVFYEEPGEGSWVNVVSDNGIAFDPATRRLTTDTDTSATSAPSNAQGYAVYYVAEDKNGSQAVAITALHVASAPTFTVTAPATQAIADMTFTVGESVSVTLPEADGGATRLFPDLTYRLSPAVPGISFVDWLNDPRLLSGTPTATGSGSVTYTATDRNGVTASATFTITVNAATGAPTSKPTVSTLNIQHGGEIVVLGWADVAKASSYVVQIVPKGGAFASWAVQTLPAGGHLTLFGSGSLLSNGMVAQGMVQDLAAGTYEVRVAAANGKGTGPWSTTAEFTVPGVQPQQQAQPDPSIEGSSGSSMAAGTSQQQQAQQAPSNRAPTVAAALPDVTGLEVDGTREVSLSGVFDDADGDAVTVTAGSSNEAAATVSVATDYSALTLTGVAVGTATITVTAQDADGNTVSDAFEVEVAKKYAGLIAQMHQWREDPRWRSFKAHTDRWDRALLAFGETVADQTLTAMTADEAQGYADRGSAWSRWVEVAKALKEIEAG